MSKYKPTSFDDVAAIGRTLRKQRRLAEVATTASKTQTYQTTAKTDTAVDTANTAVATAKDAATITITSSNGTIFKNSAISTVLTAHVYNGGVEVTGSALTALGTIKWYKDGSATAAATGSTFTIDAGDVTGKATYVAQLEGQPMAVKASYSITIASINDVTSTSRYYLLQSSTLAAPSKPTANPPGGSWSTTEPTYTEDSTNSLYFVDETIFSDGTWAYSAVSLSTSYEAAKAAYNKAVAAAKLATTINNYFSQDSAGAHVGTVEGNPNSGYNLLMAATMIALRLDGTDLMRLADNLLELGCNSTNAQIKLCGSSATMSAEKTSDARYPSDSSYPSETSYPSTGTYFNVVAPAGVRIEGNGCSIATGATSVSDTTSSVTLQGPYLRIQDGTHDGVFDMSKLYDLLNT